jgi:hypothetical protein
MKVLNYQYLFSQAQNLMDGQARGNSSSNLADDEKCFDECIVCSDQVGCLTQMIEMA